MKTLHERTRLLAETWFASLEERNKEGILNHYGAMPAVEAEYWAGRSGPAWCWWVLAILPLDTQAQVTFHISILSMFVIMFSG